MIVFTPNVTLSSLVIWTTVDFQMLDCVIVCHHEATFGKQFGSLINVGFHNFKNKSIPAHDKSAQVFIIFN